jgi:endonuclease/exonuclease/phosphatase family metal-dependent hydrolase
MKIMTFNIRYGSAKDGTNCWDYRKDNLLDIIEKYSPDILGLQEVEYFQLKVIQDKFPFYRTVGTSRNGDLNYGEINPILFKETFYSTQSGTFWLSDTPDTPSSSSYGNRLPRICTWSEFNLNDFGEKFYVLNTHLDHESPNARVKGSKQILEFLSNKDKVVLMGDFNCHSEKSDEIKECIKSNLIDSYRVMHPEEKNCGTFHNFSGIPDKEKIDYIFVRGFQVDYSSIIKDNQKGKYPSDHFPVHAIIK